MLIDTTRTFILSGTLVATLPVASVDAAVAKLTSPDNEPRGTVTLLQTEAGVLLRAKVTGLQSGVHAFHIHETGKCTPSLKSAGGHFAPSGNAHGFLTKTGPHAGDMPNFHIPDGAKTFEFEVLNTLVRLAKTGDGALFDEDGSAIVIHEGGDDYKSQPAGASGNRVACGVIERQ